MQTMHNMDIKAVKIVKDYVLEHLDETDSVKKEDTNPYIVWKCKTIQNWKYLLSTDLHDGMYYELTFNGDKQEWYLDAYKKFEKRCISDNLFKSLTLAESKIEE